MIEIISQKENMRIKKLEENRNLITSGDRRIEIELKINKETIIGKWNQKFYNSDIAYKRIYITPENEEPKEIHLTKKDYIVVLGSEEAVMKQKEIEIKYKISKMFDKLSRFEQRSLLQELLNKNNISI